jgi:hypothetical protein
MSDSKTPTDKTPEATPDTLVKITPEDGVVITETDLEKVVGGAIDSYKKFD